MPAKTSRNGFFSRTLALTVTYDLGKSNSTAETDLGAGQFAQLGLSDVMLQALELAAYHAPTPIQAGMIPLAMQGIDILGQARTGTGKTAAFAIPILEQITGGSRGAPPQALILTPTRELAVQVRDEIVKLARGRRTTSATLYGGKPLRGQTAKLQKGVDIVVGTPGRVLDHIGRRSLDLRQLKVVVLDEADRMLDIGFRPDIEKILRRCPSRRQTMLLSATISPQIERLSQKYMHEPKLLNFSQQSKAGETIDQYYFSVDEQIKFDLLIKLLNRERPEQAIVFCRTKRGTDRLHRRLSDKFEAVDCIHGDMPQRSRDSVMKRFRAGDIRLLIATDVVGRGIDVTSISHIINFDMPQSSDDYVHRVGRTGRMGRQGVAYTFVTPEEGPMLTRIEMLINKLLQRDEIEGFATTVAAVSAAALAALESGEAASPAGKEKKAEPSEQSSSTPASSRRRRRHRRAL